MNWRKVLAVLLLGLASGNPGATKIAGAYEVDPSLHGVTVRGQVTLNGSIPKARMLPVHRDNAVCGATVPDEALRVDPATRGISSVIVSLEDVTKGKPLPEENQIVIENLTCRFFKRASAVLVGSVVQIKNSDPIMHNTHIRRESRFGSTVINVAQPVGAPIIEKDLEETGLFDVRCDAHTFMRAAIYVFEHPYFTVTDESGNFALTHVPPGTYRLRYWHEVLGMQEQQVTVPPSGDLSVKLELESPR